MAIASRVKRDSTSRPEHALHLGHRVGVGRRQGTGECIERGIHEGDVTQHASVQSVLLAPRCVAPVRVHRHRRIWPGPDASLDHRTDDERADADGQFAQLG